ncbi:hypothetical protein [Halogeometricum borinquense]|uniref:hypothetical protein n=1 Tax=Halogeometricum borinquense TaxID=60847 RepID=UPI0034250EBC
MSEWSNGSGGVSEIPEKYLTETEGDAAYAATAHSHSEYLTESEGDGRYSMGQTLTLPMHHTEYQSGLTDEEIVRVSLASDETLVVHRLGTSFKGGGTSSDFSIDVFNESNSSVVTSTSTTITPGTTVTGPAEIVVRVTNATDTVKTASITGSMEVR